MGAMLLSES